MKVHFQEFTLIHYEEAMALWQASEGVGLSDSDSREGIGRYLERNPGTSFLAWDRGRVVGAVLCGHDGRRGIINHLAVHPEHRGRGIGSALVARCLAALEAAGIGKAHVFVLRSNDAGQRFWQGVGWALRTDLHLLSRTLA